MSLLSKLSHGVRVAKVLAVGVPPFLPSTKRKYLDIHRRKIEYFQPLIEKRTGVSLGNIRVEDLGDQPYTQAVTIMNDLISELGRIPTEKDIRGVQNFIALVDIYASFVKSFRAARHPIKTVKHLGNSGDAYYDERHNVIRPNLGMRFRIASRLMSSEKLESIIEQNCIHELSHALWSAVETPENREIRSDGKQVWNEGFATFCQAEYFSDFYTRPPGELRLEGIYARGYLRVFPIAKMLGERAFLELPNTWQDYQRNEDECEVEIIMAEFGE